MPLHQKVNVALVVAICTAVASVAGMVVAIVSLVRTVRPATYAASVSVTAQRRAVEQAAVTPNPECHPVTPTKMGTCNPTQAVAAAQAVAPDGNKVVATPNVNASARTDGALGALLATGIARAAGPLDRGVDVSSYQGCNINWPATRQQLGITWALAKVGEGPTWTDYCAAHNVAGFKAAHLIYGAYYFARNTMVPEAAADRAWQLARQYGYTASLPLTLDYETNDAGLSPAGFCGWANRFAVRYMADSHRQALGLYTAKFIWPGCVVVRGVYLHDAAYGPSWNLLSSFAAVDAWQYSDGQVGPYPHLAVNGAPGDSDIWLSGHQRLLDLGRAVPPPQPIALTYWQACGALDGIHWWKAHHGHVSASQHRHAVAIRLRLARDGYGCSTPGWQLRPARPFTSYPYRLPPHRPGALA